ncbi:neural cell adhesion molecule 1 isoform X1 [Leptinotarsa decemlineata]|uniref:neural cell adhesion molecule 1 isoform X1 n=1 Tax=Leptinotarsa decemlineata TaxID=7539 RepID=UPI003D3089E5
MAKDETFIALLVITLIDIAASSLYVSRPKSVLNVGESMAVVCKDEGGQLVTWRGPKGPLRANTQPSVQDTAVGKLLKFNNSKVEHTGNYTCSLSNNMDVKKVFTLIVEERNTPKLSTFRNSVPFNPYNPPRETTTEDTFVDFPETRYETETEIESQTETEIETETYNFVSKLNTPPPIYEESIKFIDTPEEQRAVENKQVLLRCEVSGEADISWTVEDEELIGPKYAVLADGLLITNVSRNESNKTFICQASQTATGAFITRNIKLIVEHKPEPEFEEYEKVVEVYGFLGEFVNLTCSVMAEPAPRFSWVKKTGKIIKVGTHQSVLQVYMTERATGTYQCSASNPHGELITIFNLLIGKRPEPPLKVELRNYTKDSLTLSIELPVVIPEDIEEGMEPKWLVVQYRKNGSEEWNSREFNISQDYATEEPEDLLTTEETLYELEEILYLSDLEKSTTYEVIAATRNVASMSDYTNSSYFETSESAKVRTNSVLNVILVNLLILFVSTPA